MVNIDHLSRRNEDAGIGSAKPENREKERKRNE